MTSPTDFATFLQKSPFRYILTNIF